MTDRDTRPDAAERAPAADGVAAFPVSRALLWLGVAGASAALTFVLVRTAMRGRTPALDDQAARVQGLIDEANRLIRALDEKKRDA